MQLWIYILGSLVGLALGAIASVFLHLFAARRISAAKSAAEIMTVSVLRLLVGMALFLLVFLVRNSIPFNFYATIIGVAVGLSATSIILSSRMVRKSAQNDRQKKDDGKEE